MKLPKFLDENSFSFIFFKHIELDTEVSMFHSWCCILRHNIEIAQELCLLYFAFNVNASSSFPLKSNTLCMRQMTQQYQQCENSSRISSASIKHFEVHCTHNERMFCKQKNLFFKYYNIIRRQNFPRSFFVHIWAAHFKCAIYTKNENERKMFSQQKSN